MSFDIFITGIKDGDQGEFPLRIVEQAFGPFIGAAEVDEKPSAVDAVLESMGVSITVPKGERKKRYWLLQFADGGGCEIFIDGGEQIGGFTMSRPPLSPAFWEALIDIMKQTDTVLWWPKGGAVVAKESTRAQMPADMMEVMGVPKVTTDMKEILDFIAATG